LVRQYFYNIRSRLQVYGEWSWGRISWDQNSTFSGGRIFDHEIKIPNNEHFAKTIRRSNWP
jgi:hypothetical protein